MNKSTKICALILIILSVLGITTSVNAYCVEGWNTDVIEKETKRETVAILPGAYKASESEAVDNIYAKDYILTAGDYTYEERQDAYYCIIGDPYGNANELYYKALEYQEWKLAKEAEDIITLEKDEKANTIISNGNLVYGPIYVNYLYGETTELRRSWGGFLYSFFDDEGNNIIDKIKLCTLINGEYVEVNSEQVEEGEMSGYNKITTDEYKNAKLYILAEDKSLSKVYMKVRSFQLVRTAKIIRIEGTCSYPDGVTYCKDCKGKTEPVYGPVKCGTCTKNAKGQWVCSSCGEKSDVKVHYKRGITGYESVSCGKTVNLYKLGNVTQERYCGQYYEGGTFDGQSQEIVEEEKIVEELFDWAELEIELGATIEIDKQWVDYENEYKLRPEKLKFNVYRSLDQKNWEKLSENVDYSVIIENKDKANWKILIAGLVRVNENGKDYYFKVEEQAQTYFDDTYPNGKYPNFKDNPAYGHMTIVNTLKHINMEGYAWLDGQTGIKPAVPHNGIMDKNEKKLENIVVYLYYRNPKDKTVKKVAQTVTDKNGHYEFKDYEIGYYYTEFYYDGIHYEDTIKVEKGSAKAFENVNNVNNRDRRNTFNSRFQTITYQKSNDGTTLNYKYENKKSILITNDSGKTTIKKEFQMTAETPLELISLDVSDLNLGLVKRGLDIALSTDVYDAIVTINGQATDYKYRGVRDLKLVWNDATQNWEIGQTETKDKIAYNLSLYASDYNYRIRDYVNTQNFQEKDFINKEDPTDVTTGNDLKVQVIYELNVQNQSTKVTKINEVKYVYDEKYTFVGLKENSYSVQNTGNTLTINLNGTELKEGETKTLYLVFDIKETNNAVNLGDFTNKAEITSYSNSEGLIDQDSQPGNFINNNEVEDDNDTAGGLKVTTTQTDERKITGKVFDEDGNNVNDVIVQLIEQKVINGKVYEYIWQETVSGTNKGLRLNADGTTLEQYTYTKTDGYYEFRGFIPGDYIVRFIYGDGTTYDMTGNVIKYNGQDYKSMTDNNYNAEWYNTSSYTTGASVARDNEARRLETMSYAVEIDAKKGILLKLLDGMTPSKLNVTEKETIKKVYKDIYGTEITQVTQEVIDKLLKEQTLENTWMCAETSKIKVAVDTENKGNTNTETLVNGVTQNFVSNITNINLGLEKRPVTKIELKKYITGFKLVASNGQTLVNAYIDVNEYLNGETDISGKVQGIKDHVTILNNLWQYEVAPTEINTIIDGASLEFEYTLVARNIGADDYISTELANAYKDTGIANYKDLLVNKASEMKDKIREGTYKDVIGKYVGKAYYTGGTTGEKVLTEITDIRDYVNNDLEFVTSGKVAEDTSAPNKHRILRDDLSMQEITLGTILKTTESTGKMKPLGEASMYKISVGKNPISSTGNLSFDTYIAEVMSYTNAAGRRADSSTPGNAEIIDAERREGRSHEIDEADTGRIQIGAATGEDKETNNIMIIAIIAGITLISAGAFVVKKYLIK